MRAEWLAAEDDQRSRPARRVLAEPLGGAGERGRIELNDKVRSNFRPFSPSINRVCLIAERASRKRRISPEAHAIGSRLAWDACRSAIAAWEEEAASKSKRD
jgi:hypothetical protein